MQTLDFLITCTSILCAVVLSVRGSPIPLRTISEEASLKTESPVFTLPDAEAFVLLLPEPETIKSVPATSSSVSTVTSSPLSESSTQTTSESSTQTTLESSTQTTSLVSIETASQRSMSSETTVPVTATADISTAAESVRIFGDEKFTTSSKVLLELMTSSNAEASTGVDSTTSNTYLTTGVDSTLSASSVEKVSKANFDVKTAVDSTTSTSNVDMTQTSGFGATTSVYSTLSMDAKTSVEFTKNVEDSSKLNTVATYNVDSKTSANAKTSVELATNDEDYLRLNTDVSSDVNLTTKANQDVTNEENPTTSNLNIYADVEITTASNENASDEEFTTSSNIEGQTDLNNKKSRIVRSLTTESSVPELSLNREVLDRTYRASRQLQTRVDVQYSSLMSELSLSILSLFHVEAAYSTRPSLPDGVKIDANNCRHIQAVIESIKAVTLEFLPYANDFSSTAIRDSLYSVAWNVNKLLPSPTLLPMSVPASGKKNSIDLIYTLLALQHQTQVISETLLSLQQCH